MKHSLKVLQIVPGTSVDGPGLRTSIYLAGCSHQCPGCHNPASWDFSAGREMTVDEVMEIIRLHGFNVTLTGGDPLLHQSIEAVEELIEEIKREDLNIWVYTGFTYEHLRTIPSMARILEMVDVFVDGPFIQNRLSPSLPFRGSDNQRIIGRGGVVITDYDNPYL